MALDITDNEIYNGLVGFIKLVVPAGTPILRGQQNRVPMPNTDFVLLTTLGAPRRIGTNLELTEPAGWQADSQIPADSNTPADSGGSAGFTQYVTADFEYRVQADFYSALAESWSMAAELLWYGKPGWYQMPAGMKPLYSEDRRQLPLVGGEQQWIQRWTMTLVLDYQPTWTQTTEAATVATVIPEPIDAYFPP